ncbi:MAG: hemerythrin domain-containing protein [Verrucomicrobiota bacterium]
MATTSIDPTTTLQQLLHAMPEHRPVMECLGVNAARDGDRTFAEFCELRGLESRTIARVLAAFREAKQRFPAVCVELMTLDQLCDQMESAHRRLHDELKELDRLTRTLAKENVAENPKLLVIRKSFLSFQRRFKAHLRKESEHLFPVCRRWAASRNEKRRARVSFKPSLAQLQREHNQADEALADLRSIVVGDSSASSAQAAVQTISEAVARLEHSVHEQIYKENQILFPKALGAFARVRPTLRSKSVQHNQSKETCHESNRRRLS